MIYIEYYQRNLIFLSPFPLPYDQKKRSNQKHHAPQASSLNIFYPEKIGSLFYTRHPFFEFRDPNELIINQQKQFTLGHYNFNLSEMQPNNNFHNQNSYQHQGYQQPNILVNNNRPSPQSNNYNPMPLNNGFLSPQGGNNGNFNNYAPTIQTSISPSNKPAPFGSNKLSAMGRFIKDQPEMNFKSHQTPPNFLYNPSLQEDKGKMASSMIFQRNISDDLNRFPGFNLGPSQQATTGGNKLEALLNRKKSQPVNDILSNETPQQKRKREIIQMRQQFAVINKKLENKIVTKEEGGQTKQYFQLPTRKTVQVTPTQMAQQVKSIRQQQANKPQDSNFSIFNKYSKGNASQTTSVSSNQSKYTPQIKGNTMNYVQKSEPTKFSNPITTVNPISEPVKQQSGGMFKKKNLYINQDNNSEAFKKTFIVSPKAALSIPVKTQPLKFQAYQSKAAQVILPTQPKKSIKRIDSFDNVPVQVKEQPRKFQKSDFKIGKKMGKGQFGQVMLVQHKITGFLCGLKVMSKKQIRQQKYVNQIARELSIQFYLNHRNVAPLYGYFQDQENVYLLVQFCTGGQLLEMLRKKHRMQENDTSPIIRQICEGLDYIHKQEIIHRDIKPENILFNFNTVKICDFGWAVHCGTGMRKTVSGSPLYYSPEVVMETEYDEKVDIWAIGMMTYECLLGKIPFKIYSQLDLNRIVSDQVKFPEYVDVTDDAKDFILGIMKKIPQERMGIKQIFKHPFIKKYLQEKKVANEILQQFRKILNAN